MHDESVSSLGQERSAMEQERSAIWSTVWSYRDDDRADWNGFEACFDSVNAYERWVDEVSALLIARLDLGSSDVVGDLGCGTGRVAACIAPHVRTVHAFDYSDTVLDVARRRRPHPNVSYRRADLNAFNPGGLGLTKAFSFGALLYLNSDTHVFGLIRSLNKNNIDFAALDLPDEQTVDDRPRAYDTSVFTHLRLSEERLLNEFPTAYVGRGEFPDYVNGRTRFNFYLPALRPNG
jgi:SAM-dependent methyltransferase